MSLLAEWQQQLWLHRLEKTNRVKVIQKALQAEVESFYRGPIDGEYGPGTEEAVINFQERYMQAEENSPVRTGYVDNRMWDLLFAQYEK
jgi:hypothetical protein